jgi:hypothetical protein
MADEVQFSAFTKRELANLAKTFTLMGEDAIDSSRQIAFEIAELAKDKIRDAGYTRTKSGGAIRRLVDGSTISRTSKTGRLSYGFANQRLSGGATTQQLWGGLEFGSSIKLRKDGSVRRFNQFPQYSGRYGKGSRGWFIYPTLREIQPELTAKYLKAMNEVVKVWSN